MNTRTYYGKIRLTTGGHAVEVSCNATSLQQARTIIESQFGSSFKCWVKNMSSLNF